MENKTNISKLNHFDALNAVDVSGKTKKKKSGNTELTYLSWCWGWAEVKKKYPDAQYEILKFDGLPYIYDEMTGYMVFTRATVEGVTHEMWLPVMDGANKAMKSAQYTYSTRFGDKTVESATMFDINKTIMRCLTKNLAMFGLGLYIYADEDLPEAEKEKRSKKDEEDKLAAQEAKRIAAENEKKVKPIRDKILIASNEKIAEGFNKNKIYEIIAKENGGEKNPNTIKDIETAEKILKMIKTLEAK